MKRNIYCEAEPSTRSVLVFFHVPNSRRLTVLSVSDNFKLIVCPVTKTLTRRLQRICSIFADDNIVT